MQLSDDFVKFCSVPWRFSLTLPAPERELPSDMQAQSQGQSNWETSKGNGLEQKKSFRWVAFARQSEAIWCRVPGPWERVYDETMKGTRGDEFILVVFHYVWQKICCNHCRQQPAPVSFDRRVESSKSCVNALLRKERTILLASVLGRKPLTSARW